MSDIPDIRTELSKPPTNKFGYKGRLEVQYAGKQPFLVYSKSYKVLEELIEEVILCSLDSDTHKPLRILQEIVHGTDLEVFQTETKHVTYFVVSKPRKHK